MSDLLAGISPARLFGRPTADSTWLGPAQQAALSHLSGAARDKALLGPRSSGRSTVLQYLGTHLDGHVVLHLSGPKSDARSVLAALLLSAELAPWELAEVDQRNLLCVLIQQRCAQGRRVIVAVDDPDELSEGAWDELERLRSWRDTSGTALEIALCAPDDPEHPSARFAAGLEPREIHSLGAPGEDEVAAYLDWRLGQAGLANPFTDPAVRLMARCTEGRFTGINVLAQMALLLARQREEARVDARIVHEASTALAKRRYRASAESPFDGLPSGREQGVPAAHLLVSRDGAVLSRVALGERVLIGRSEHNDLCLQSPYLSRHHAVIIGTREGFYIVDLNSVNGLTVNKRLMHRSVLYDRDVICLGPYRLKVQFADAVASQNPLPDTASLAETAVMPAQPGGPPPARVSVVRN
jgi:type II secretory pathway predicted ATPase ExeA